LRVHTTNDNTDTINQVMVDSLQAAMSDDVDNINLSLYSNILEIWGCLLQ